MTNILLVSTYKLPSYYLAIKDFQRLENKLGVCFHFDLIRNIRDRDIAWCDIALIIRGDDPLSADFAQLVYKTKRKVYLLLDDDLLEYRSQDCDLNNKRRIKALKKIINISDCIITPSQYLGEKYKNRFNKPYALINTIVEDIEIRTCEKSDTTVRILYAAGKGHILFFDALIRPIMSRLFEKFGNRISFTLIGPQVSEDIYPGQLFNYEYMPLDTYRELMEKERFDIGLAPLFDFELGRSKYINKYLEYSRYSICGIYSKVLPYTSVISNYVNGILSENTPEAWYESISSAIDNLALRHECVNNAQRQILSKHRITTVAQSLISSLPQLVQFKAPAYKVYRYHTMYISFVYYELMRRVINILNL